MTLAALTRADYALLVAVLSALASVASLSWQLYSALRVDRARFRVKVAAVLMALPSPPPQRFVRVGVVNDGKRASNLSGLWLHLGTPPAGWRRLLPGKKLSLLTPDNAGRSLSTQLPTRLDVGDEAYLLYDTGLVVRKAAEIGARTVYGVASGATAKAYSKVLRVKSFK